MPNNTSTETNLNRNRSSINSRHRVIRNRTEFRRQPYRVTGRQSYSTQMNQIRALTTSLKEQIEFIAELLHIDNGNSTQEHNYGQPFDLAFQQLTDSYNITRAIRRTIISQVIIRQPAAIVNSGTTTYTNNPANYPNLNNSLFQQPVYYPNNTHH